MPPSSPPRIAAPPVAPRPAPAPPALAPGERLLPTCLASALVVLLGDFLFWKHPVGLSLAIFVVALAGLIVARNWSVARTPRVGYYAALARRRRGANRRRNFIHQFRRGVRLAGYPAGRTSLPSAFCAMVTEFLSTPVPWKLRHARALRPVQDIQVRLHLDLGRPGEVARLAVKFLGDDPRGRESGRQGAHEGPARELGKFDP